LILFAWIAAVAIGITFSLSPTSFQNEALQIQTMDSGSPQETFGGYLQSLSEENILLTQEIEKKDAIIMEQLKVIQDLAEKVSKISFESKLSNFSLV